MEVVEIAQTIGIISTLSIAIWQSRAQTKAIKAATYAKIIDRNYDINRLIFENSETYAELDEVGENSNIDLSDKRTNMVSLLFIAFEEIYVYHKRYKILNDYEWDVWENLIESYMSKAYILEFWKVRKLNYSKDFREFIDNILRNGKTKEI